MRKEFNECRNTNWCESNGTFVRSGTNLQISVEFALMTAGNMIRSFSDPFLLQSMICEANLN